MEDNTLCIILLFIVGFVVYSIGNTAGTDKCKNETLNLAILNEKYIRLNDSYNDLNNNYTKLNESYTQLLAENELLKEKQKDLANQIASYLVEQATIDLLGLEKYSMAYDIIKIFICNKNPAIIFCAKS